MHSCQFDPEGKLNTLILEPIFLFATTGHFKVVLLVSSKYTELMQKKVYRPISPSQKYFRLRFRKP